MTIHASAISNSRLKNFIAGSLNKASTSTEPGGQDLGQIDPTNPLYLFYQTIKLMKDDIKNGNYMALFKHDVKLVLHLIDTLKKSLIPL